MSLPALLRLVPVAVLVAAPLPADVWPSFRGAGGQGMADAQSLPTDWDVRTGRNVRFAAPHSRSRPLESGGVGRSGLPDHGRGREEREPRPRRQGRHRSRVRCGPSLLAAPGAPRRRRPRAVADRGLHGTAPRAAPREGEPGQRDPGHRRPHHRGPLRLAGPGRLRLERHGALARGPWDAEPRPLRRSHVGVGPCELSRAGRRPRVRSGRSTQGRFRGRVRPRHRPAPLDGGPQRAHGLGDAAVSRRGRAQGARGHGRLPRPRLRPGRRPRALALQGRRRGEDTHAVPGRKPPRPGRGISWPAALRLAAGGFRRHLGGRQRREQPLPGLAHRAGGAVHLDPPGLRRAPLRGARRGHLDGLRLEHGRPPLPRAHGGHPQRVPGGERRPGVPRHRGRTGAGAQGRRRVRGDGAQRHGRDRLRDPRHRQPHPFRADPRAPLRHRAGASAKTD